MLSVTLKIKALFRFIISGKYKYLYGSIRRRLIFYFAKRYFKRQMSRKRGMCSLNGHCCNITMPWCPYLKNGKCSVYYKQPLFCRIFPIDEKDKELSDVKNICSLHFD